MSVCYSAIKPSGDITLGNYFGTVRSWRDLAKEHECFFCIADLHAITVAQDPTLLRERSMSFMAFYLACGFDPKHVTLYFQSQVPEHAELQWLLTCITHMGELGRMTQFKDKSSKHSEKAIPVGLFAYPVLMAADIMLFQSNFVPVGDDQKQHLELCRNLIERFNQRFQTALPIPDPIISQDYGRLMGLQYPEKKMSKSEDNASNVILFTDPVDKIRKKIMRAVTDSESELAYDPENRPGVSNLINLFAAMSGSSRQVICDTYAQAGYGTFKRELADAVIAVMEPIQNEMAHYLKDPEHIMLTAKEGGQRARAVASNHLNAMKEKIGLII